jgi:hypothetical protein
MFHFSSLIGYPHPIAALVRSPGSIPAGGNILILGMLYPEDE